MKFNMLLCWCIGKAASGIEEFYMLPQNGKLYKYDCMALNVIAENIKGGLSFCDVAVSDDLEQFNANYLQLTETISRTCQDILDKEAVQSQAQNSTASSTSTAASSPILLSPGGATAKAG